MDIKFEVVAIMYIYIIASTSNLISINILQQFSIILKPIQISDIGIYVVIQIVHMEEEFCRNGNCSETNFKRINIDIL